MTDNASDANARFLARAQASDYLFRKYGMRCKPSTLAKLATVGGGPVFQRIGRFPAYTPENLDRYAESRLSKEVRSTSEFRSHPNTRPAGAAA
jgi:hypothetical protein